MKTLKKMKEQIKDVEENTVEHHMLHKRIREAEKIKKELMHNQIGIKK